MKTIGPVCAVVLPLLGCANGLPRQPKATTVAEPPAAASVRTARPAAPTVELSPVATRAPARKAPQPASAAVEPPVKELVPAPRSTLPVAAAEPVIAPQPV